MLLRLSLKGRITGIESCLLFHKLLKFLNWDSSRRCSPYYIPLKSTHHCNWCSQKTKIEKTLFSTQLTSLLPCIILRRAWKAFAASMLDIHYKMAAFKPTSSLSLPIRKHKDFIQVGPLGVEPRLIAYQAIAQSRYTTGL